MPRLVDRQLTASRLQALKPASHRFEIFDMQVRGLGMRVAPSGTKTWFLMRWINGNRSRVTLGRYPDLSLADAREKATEISRRLAHGDTPAKEQKQAFLAIVEEWLRRDQASNRSHKEVDRAMRRYVLPEFKNRRLKDIRRGDIVRLLDRIVDAGAPIQANRVLAYFRRLANWCLERGMLERNPVAGIPPPAKEISRDRVLTPDEMARIWRAADRIGYPWGRIVQLLMLTAQRLHEVADATWEEFDLPQGLWSLPAARAKNGRPHAVHLAAPALEILSDLPHFAGSAWLFTTTGATPVSGFSKAKRRLDLESGVVGWTHHDLRRSFATHATESMGISPVVIDRILNHVAGSVKGVAAVYQRGEYLLQRQSALSAWGTWISTLQVPNNNVITLTRR